MIRHTVKIIPIVLFAFILVTPIYNWMTGPSDSLEMKLHFGVNRISPILTTEFDTLYNFIKSEKIVSEIDLTKILGENPSAADTRLAEILLRSIVYRLQGQVQDAEISFRKFHHLSGYWLAKVVNNDTRRLTDVVAFLPGTTYVSIEREGEKAIFRESSDSIKVGSLRPSEVVLLYAWTNRNISIDDAKKAYIVHDQIIGDKTTYALVGWVGQAVDHLWPTILFLFFHFIVFTVLLELQYRFKIGAKLKKIKNIYKFVKKKDDAN